MVSMASTGFSRRRSGRVFSSFTAAQRARSRSRENATSMSGRRIFTATWRPSASVARCTCAMDAAAIGSASKVANSSSTGLPSSASTACRASAPSNGGSRSCNERRSSASSSPTRSGRTDSACPSFTKAGPSSVSAAVNRSPGRCDFMLEFRGANSASRIRAGAIRGNPAPSRGNSSSCRASVRATETIRRKWRRPENMLQVRQPECCQTIPPVSGVTWILPNPASVISAASAPGSGNWRMLSARYR